MLSVSKGWQLSGIQNLEPNAWKVLSACFNTCVTSGPGAGKTELLAQRATYLLQTGLCAYPQKILAISFKRDAARNLQARVDQRYETKQVSRFVSMTYDAFSKNLLDRFLTVIPKIWRPQSNYTITTFDRNFVNRFLSYAKSNAPAEYINSIYTMNYDNFESIWLGSSLSVADKILTPQEWVQRLWWSYLKENGNKGSLTYLMVNRLAQLILKIQPEIRKALQLTYPFIFLDEFQDTTFMQYDLIKTAFYGSQSILTAVGDSKQRIMLWAGAMSDAFSRFKEDFKAKPISLLCNHRSHPELVAIQHVVAQSLEPESPPIESRAKKILDGAHAEIWTFTSEEKERDYLVNWIKNDASNNMLHPRDYGLLVRQRPDIYENLLKPSFVNNNLGLRNESRIVEGIPLQDLLSDDVCKIILHFLTLAIHKHAPDSFKAVLDAICDLHNVNSDDVGEYRLAEKSVDNFIKSLNYFILQKLTVELAQQLLQRIISYLNIASIHHYYFQYASGDLLDKIVRSFTKHMLESCVGQDTWKGMLDQIFGKEQTPLMTIHKSKGLEFHTVLFLGLDDVQWWSHGKDRFESLATFFVALSRAKQRVFFTYCSARKRDVILDIYDLLKQAGVREVFI